MTGSTRWGNYVALLVLVGGLAGGWYARRRQQQIHTRPRYAIGVLTSSALTPKSGQHYNYKYTLGNQLYYGSGIYEHGMEVANGGRFLVEYDRLNPEISTGHFAVPIPDSVETNPVDGWQLPPFPVPAQYLPNHAPGSP